MKIVTAAEMREIDRRSSADFGIPSLTLMENAGTAVAQFLLARYPSAQVVGVVCGKGNNGGDGFVVARKLREAGKHVQLLLLTDPGTLTGDAAEMYERLPAPVEIATTADALAGPDSQKVMAADVLVDAILGTGFRPPVTGLYADAIARLNSGAAPVIAVDIPSGAEADAMIAPTAIVRATAVVSFTAPHIAHVFAPLTAGPTVIAPIGSPEQAIVSGMNLHLITPQAIAPLLAARPRESNKGSFGHVLVVGGSLGKAGAAAMAGMSVLRAGAGLSTVATARSALGTVAGFHPEVMTEPLEETEAGTISMRALEYGRLDKLVESKTVLAVGPGISRHPETAEFVRSIVSKYETPMVLDADGLNAFEGAASKLNGKGRVLVITPHPGEMARLLGTTVPEVQKDRIKIARDFAAEHQVLVVLKGHRTLVAGPQGTVWVNPTGNPGMATGGTGDILTGMVAGMMAQHPKDPLIAVSAAVYLHGLAGDIGRELKGEISMVATDLVHAVPEAIRRVRAEALLKSVTFGG
jgi:NAD(P)H-hydrate epimerase